MLLMFSFAKLVLFNQICITAISKRLDTKRPALLKAVPAITNQLISNTLMTAVTVIKFQSIKSFLIISRMTATSNIL